MFLKDIYQVIVPFLIGACDTSVVPTEYLFESFQNKLGAFIVNRKLFLKKLVI